MKAQMPFKPSPCSGFFWAACLFVWGGLRELPAQTTFTIANTPGYPGTTVSVPIKALKATNIVAAQFDFAYNPAKTTPGTPTLTSVNAGHTIRSREVAPGVRRTIIYSLNNSLLRTNGFNATVPFQTPAQERVGSGPIIPGNVILAKRDATAVTPITVSSGAVFVRSVNPLPDGTVQFFLPSEAEERYVIQATTDFFNWVSLTNITAASEFMDLVDVDAARYPHRFYRWVLRDAVGEIGVVTQLSGGGLSFQLTGLAGRTYVLQASTNLQAWTDVSTNVAAVGTLSFTNLANPVFPHRFFRFESR